MNHMILSSVAITNLPAFSAGRPMGIQLALSEYVYKGMGPELQSQRNDAPPIVANDTPLRKGP